jgi:hypothetical protein
MEQRTRDVRGVVIHGGLATGGGRYGCNLLGQLELKSNCFLSASLKEEPAVV